MKNLMLARCLPAIVAACLAWTPAPAAAAAKPSAVTACTPSQTASPITFTQSFSYQGTARDVLYVGPAAQPCSAPAYVLLTYLNGTPSQILDIAQATRLAQQYGAWVIVPSQIGGLWNHNPPFQSIAGVTVPSILADDSGFLAALIDDAVSRYNVDATRVVMAGLSDGALMASYFACVHPEKLLGAVIVAGTELTTVMLSCKPSQPVSIVNVIGTADLLSPYYVTALNVSAAQFKTQWEKLDSCPAATETSTSLPIQVQDGTSVTRSRCIGKALVEQYTILNGGHAWAGGTPDLIEQLLFGITSQNLDATIVPWLDLLALDAARRSS